MGSDTIYLFNQMVRVLIIQYAKLIDIELKAHFSGEKCLRLQLNALIHGYASVENRIAHMMRLKLSLTDF